MGDKRSLQAGTSHYLGQNFAKAFDVTFQTKDNKEDYVYATSWGISTRLVGAVIMVHGDDKGLRLPPKIAPYQVVIVPIARNKDHEKLVKDFIEPITFGLKENNVRVHEDWSDNSPGFKFNEWEMKGAPIRMEVGPRDVENNQVILVRRDTNEKFNIGKEDLLNKIPNLLDEIQLSLFKQAKNFRDENTHTINSYDEFKDIVSNGGFVRCGWDGDAVTETAIKNETKATIRCIPFDEQTDGLSCIYSGKPAKHEVIYAKAY